MVNVYIKNVDDEAYKKAKLLAVQHDLNIGEVISKAVNVLSNKLSAKRVENPLDFLRSVKLKSEKSSVELCQEAEDEFW